MADKLSMAPGAKFSVKYCINDEDTEVLEGTYKGMAMIGSDAALVFDVGGRMTYLRAATIVVMEQIEAAPEEDQKKAPADDRAFYG